MHRTDSGADGGTVRDLHVVALSEDGRHVVLATRAGTASGEFRVRLDERLLAVVRGELPAPGRDAPPSISPRDIQARLRDGESPEEIAASAGVPLSRVERYAGPVLAELDRVITGARAAVVTRPRLGPSALPLGEAVEVHLAEVAHLAEDSVRWSARRTDHGRWVVTVSWTARGRRRTAGWHYDPAAREVTAVDGPSAVLGHVEADALPAAPAAPAARSPRPAAAGTRGAGRAARSGSAGSRTATERTPAAAAGAAAARPTGSRTTAPSRAAAAPAAAAPALTTRRPGTTAPAPAAAPASRRRAAPGTSTAQPAARPGARAATGSASQPARKPASKQSAAPVPTAPAPVRGAAATGRAAPRRAAARRSAVPSLDEVATTASTAPPPASPPSAPPASPTPPGPPVLRVVPPSAPDLDADDAVAPEEQAPVRRAAGSRAGGRDWADVLMGSAPAAEPRQE